MDTQWLENMIGTNRIFNLAPCLAGGYDEVSCVSNWVARVLGRPGLDIRSFLTSYAATASCMHWVPYKENFTLPDDTLLFVSIRTR